MNKLHSLCCLYLLFTINLSFAQSPDIPKDVVKSMKEVKPKSIKAHIQYLADDRLQGRMPGTEGYQMAVDYIVSQFKDIGVEPAGDNGTYLQLVRLRRSVPGKDILFTITGKPDSIPPLKYGKEFTIYPHATIPQVELEASLAFAGYGISAPELGYDDYAGLDVKGKIVVIVRGAPEKFPSTIAAHSQNTTILLETAARNGAVGLIIGLNDTTVTTLPTFAKGVYSAMSKDGKVAVSRSYVSDQVQVMGIIGANLLNKLLQSSGKTVAEILTSLKSGTKVSTPLNTNVRIKYSTRFEDFDSYNVAGKITGSDTKLNQEYVVHSAHLDHMGISIPINGDSIYNGAHDNASGVASLLEIAGIYTRLKEKPKRSVLLLMVTGEEMGLLGSGYFAKTPTIPVQNIVADINTDMPTIIAPFLSAVALGADHSTLKQQAAMACSYLNIDLEPDPEPNENRFVRSDQHSFVVQGIPALHIKYGNKTANGENNLSKQVQQWRAKYYHKPQDDMNGIFDFEAGKKYVQLNFLISYLVAQNPQRTQWNPGDFFGEGAKP